MEDKIKDIRKQAKNINISELINTGRNKFYVERIEEFANGIDPAIALKSDYTSYLNGRKLVLECISEGGIGIDPEYAYRNWDKLPKTWDYIYINDGRMKTLHIEGNDDDIKDDLNYKEMIETINIANKKANTIEKEEKQHIRNFFRRIFKKGNTKLLEEEMQTLTYGEITSIIENIKEKPEKFMKKYNKQKSKEEEERDKLDTILKQMKEIDKENESERG